MFQRGCPQNSKQTVQGRQWKGANEQLSPVALFPSTAPNQEPPVDSTASPPPPNPFQNLTPGLGKVSEFWVWILVRFFENERFCGLALLQRIATKIHTKIRTPIWKIRATIRTKNSATKSADSAHQKPHQIHSQNPRWTSQTIPAEIHSEFRKGHEGCPLRSHLLLLPTVSPTKKFETKNPLRNSRKHLTATKQSEASPKHFQHLSRYLKISHQHFSKHFHPPNFAQKKKTF